MGSRNHQEMHYRQLFRSEVGKALLGIHLFIITLGRNIHGLAASLWDQDVEMNTWSVWSGMNADGTWTKLFKGINQGLLDMSLDEKNPNATLYHYALEQLCKCHKSVVRDFLSHILCKCIIQQRRPINQVYLFILIVMACPPMWSFIYQIPSQVYVCPYCSHSIFYSQVSLFIVENLLHSSTGRPCIDRDTPCGRWHGAFLEWYR